MSKISQSAADILGKLAAKRDAVARDQAEIVELERAAAWAAGRERRDRLALLGTQVRALGDAAIDTNSELAAAVSDLTTAMQRVIGLTARHNETLAELRRQIAGEGVRPHSLGPIPPSPADGGIGTSGPGLIVGDVTGALLINPIDGAHLVDVAAQAGRSGNIDALTDAVTKALDRARMDVPTPTGRFWRNDEHGAVLISDQPAYGCTEISRPEYLAASWGIELADLPADVLAELSDVERGHLAHKLTEIR